LRGELLDPLAEPPGEVLDILPRDAPRAGAAGDRPLVGFSLELLVGHVETVAPRIALDDRVVGLLVAIVEAEPEAEAVGERDLFPDRLAGVDGGRALVLDHVARQEVAPVRGGVEQDVLRPTLDAAVEHRLQRLVARILLVEREIVAEEEAAPAAAAQATEEAGKGGDILTMDFDQHPRARPRPVELAVHRLDERALAGAAGAPQKDVVGGKARGKAPRIVEQDVAHAVDAAQELEIDAIDRGYRLQPFGIGMPDEGVGGADVADRG